MSVSSGVVVSLRADGARVAVSARCVACRIEVDGSVASEQIVGYLGGDPARDGQARAVLTRLALGALRAKGCSHAMHDRAAMADCALRPDRAKLPAVLAALFDVGERGMRELLTVSALSTKWTDDSLTLRWKSGAAPELEQTSRCSVSGERAEMSVTIAVDEAWEMLCARGFVSDEWLASESRGFRTHIEQGISPTELPANVRRWRAATVPKASARGADPCSPAPTSLRACVTMAADAAGAVATEVLVREALERLEPWGASRVRRLSWRVVDASRWRTVRQSYWTESLRLTLASVLKDRQFDLPRGYGPTDAPPPPAWWSLAAAESALARLWEEMRAAGVARADGIDAARLRDFRTLPNPYEPLLAIWSTGFVLDELMPDEAVIVAAQW
jgi:hypothetical protein